MAGTRGLVSSSRESWESEEQTTRWVTCLAWFTARRAQQVFRVPKAAALNENAATGERYSQILLKNPTILSIDESHKNLICLLN